MCETIYQYCQKMNGMDINIADYIHRWHINGDVIKYIDNYKLNELLAQKTTKDIILYVDNSKQYVLFHNIAAYNNFINNVCNRFDDKVRLYQIVLTHEKQKLMFSYFAETHENELQEISAQLQSCFKSVPKILYNEKHECHQIIINNVFIEKYNDNLQHLRIACEHIKQQYP